MMSHLQAVAGPYVAVKEQISYSPQPYAIAHDTTKATCDTLTLSPTVARWKSLHSPPYVSVQLLRNPIIAMSAIRLTTNVRG